MPKLRGSALLSAMLILLVVTMFALAAVQQVAQWRADYQRVLIHEKATFKTRFDAWQAQQSSAVSESKD